jgi:hypothetical protein
VLTLCCCFESLITMAQRSLITMAQRKRHKLVLPINLTHYPIPSTPATGEFPPRELSLHSLSLPLLSSLLTAWSAAEVDLTQFILVIHNLLQHFTQHVSLREGNDTA